MLETSEPEDWVWRVRGAAAYFLVQGMGVFLQCLMLWRWPESRGYFETGLSGDRALVDLLWLDLTLIGCGSFLCAVAILKAAKRQMTQRLLWVSLGVLLYPTTQAFMATVNTGGEGWARTALMLLATQGTFLAAWSVRPEGSLFRVAPARPPAVHVVRTFIQTAFFWLLSLWLTPWLLLHVEIAFGVEAFVTPAQSWLPWVFFGVVGLLNVSTGYMMSRWGEGTPLPLETAGVFVIKGGYRVVRNPMACTGLFLGLMVGWWLGSWLTLAAVFLGGLVWHVAVRPIEERDLFERFGDVYLSYQRSVRCWIPVWPPHHARLITPEVAQKETSRSG